MTLTLRRIAGAYAVVRRAPGEGWPHWATWSQALLSITRTATETSVICAQDAVPATERAERDFAAFAVEGPLDFAAVGILARLATPLAAAGVPLLAISTFDTDVLLVRAGAASDAEAAWRAAGIVVRGD